MTHEKNAYPAGQSCETSVYLCKEFVTKMELAGARDPCRPVA
jgi:hypothetical protein